MHSRSKPEIRNLDSSSRESANRLAALVERAGLPIDVARAETLRADFAARSQEFITALSDERAALKRAAALFAEFDAQRRTVEDGLVEFAGKYETTMGEREDGVKTLIQSGRAALSDVGNVVDEIFSTAYPLVKDTYKVLRDVVRLQEFARGHMSQDNAEKLAEIQKSVEGVARNSRALQAACCPACRRRRKRRRARRSSKASRRSKRSFWPMMAFLRCGAMLSRRAHA